MVAFSSCVEEEKINCIDIASAIVYKTNATARASS